MSELLPGKHILDFSNVRDPLDDFLDAVLGPGPGYLSVEFGRGPKRKLWDARSYSWPDEREQARTAIDKMQRQRWDVYLCTALRAEPKRSRHNAADIWTLSFELDEPAANQELLDKLDAVIVLSGTEDHTHVHVLLAEPVDSATADRLTEALAKAVADWRPGSGVALKFEANALLRVPDTWNWKSYWAPDLPARRRDDDAGPRRVRVVKAQGKRWSLDELEALVASLATAAPVPRRRQGTRTQSAQAMTEDQLRGLPGVQRALVLWGGTQQGKRNEAHNAVARECYKANAPQEAAVALILDQPWCKGDETWVTADVERIYRGAESEGIPQIPSDEFWDSRPMLAHIRDFALERALPRWALLGHTLLRFSATIPPCFVLPDVIGAYGSLNLYVALVGPPGGGKTTSGAASRRVIHIPYEEPTQAPLGTGQGMTRRYMSPSREEPIYHTDSVIFGVDEVAKLRATLSRPDSILLGELNTAWAGSTLGAANADVMNTAILPSHTYRLGLHVGVQPGLADALLDYEVSGFPQRFVWFEAELPADTQRPRERTTGVWKWTPPDVSLHDLGPDFSKERDNFRVLTLPEFVEDVVWADYISRGQGLGDRIDSHRMLSRLKIAAVLMWMDSRSEGINAEDWHLSGQIMALSDATRDRAQQYRLAELAKKADESATRAGRRAALTEGAKEAVLVKKAKARILQLLADGVERTRSHVVSRGMTASLRPVAEAALDELVHSGTVRVRTTKHPTSDKKIARCRLAE
ncbi:hypothetical protein [Pseudonocardia sp. WMMC193]|uniref:hypothetical protein n=1 Tax=Pseudonocardia sp. WMMC193 TaxID=2911965 RepID=UPI001F214A3D|nr:hypothetical protein [Pseudonocardia sp. WMMC193]MCF7552206.1 hypothetical protein [Pseudonocardia sp. WMMC193]